MSESLTSLVGLSTPLTSMINESMTSSPLISEGELLPFSARLSIVPTTSFGQFILVDVSMTSMVNSMTMTRIPFPMTILVIPEVKSATLNVESIIHASKSAIPSKAMSAKLLNSKVVPFIGLMNLGCTQPMILGDQSRLVNVRVNSTLFFIFAFCFPLDYGTISRGIDRGRGDFGPPIVEVLREEV